MRFQFSRLECLYDQFAESYDDHAKAFWGFDRSLLTPFVEGATSAVEFGIGTGLNLPHYPAGAVVAGIDLSRSMLNKADQRVTPSTISLQLRHGAASDVDWEADSFDIGVATWFFSVTPTPQLDFNRLISCIRPGGKAHLIVDHFIPDDWAKAISPEDRFLIGNLHHRCLSYDPFRDIKEWINDCPNTISVESADSIGFFGNSCKRDSHFYVLVKG